MSENNNKKKKLNKFLKKFLPLIGIIIFIYLLISIGPQLIIETILGISPLILLFAIGISLVNLLLNNYIWQLIFKKQKINISYLKSLKIIFIGNFYGFITPGRLGQYAKVLYLKEETNEPTGKLFVNVFVKMALGALSFYLLWIMAAFMMVEQYPEIFIGVFIYVSIMILFYLYFVKKERGEKAIHILIKYLIPKKFKEYFTNFTSSFYQDFPNTTDFVLPFILNLFVNIISFFKLYIIAGALGINVPFHILLVFFSIAGMTAIIPISIGGLGTKEAVLVLLFSPLGVGAQQIFAVSLLGYILSIFTVVIPGLILSIIYAKNNKKLLKNATPVPEN